MNRRMILAGLSAAMALAGAAQAAPAGAPAFNPHDLSGIWFQASGGKFPEYPYTAEYAAIYKQRLADEEAGRPYQSAKGRCLPRGLVGMLTTGAYPIEISQSDAKVQFFKENGGVHRVYLKREHLPADELVPLFFGDSVGKWDGDTLVVDTISLGATDNIDGRAPHSDALHVVERFRRTAPDRLEADVTIDDAKALTKAVSTHVVYRLRNDLELQEFYCENEPRIEGGNQFAQAPK